MNTHTQGTNSTSPWGLNLQHLAGVRIHVNTHMHVNTHVLPSPWGLNSQHLAGVWLLHHHIFQEA